MAYLVLVSDGHHGTRFSLDKPDLSIGRSPECDIYLEDPSVSFQHAVLQIKSDDQSCNDEFWLNDANSPNGTFVNNRKVESIVLQHNDNIVIGLSNFKCVYEGASALESTQQIKRSWIPGVFYLKDKE